MRRLGVLLLWSLSLLSCESAVEPASNPVPVVETVEPDLLLPEEPPEIVVVTGQGFVEGTLASWNGSEREAVVRSPTSLSVAPTAEDVTTPGTVTLIVTNPEPGGGTSDALEVVVGNPRPVLESMAPTSAEAVVTPELQLNVYGSRFASGARVRWDDVPLPTSIVGSGELTAEVPDYLLRKGRTVSITVTNPEPGGGASEPLFFGSENPVPVLTESVPSGVRVETAAVLKLVGSGFVDGASVRYGGARLEPDAVSGNVLTVSVPAEMNTSGAVVPVVVENPEPAGGVSNEIEVPVWEAAPSIESFSPPSVPAGYSSFTLVILGSDFETDATVEWDGDPRPATVVDPNRIEVQISATDIETLGTRDVLVINPDDGGESAAQFEVVAPDPPEIEALTPFWAAAGDDAFTLTITGGLFLPDATVTWNGEIRPVRRIDENTIEIDVVAADLAEPGVVEVVAHNPHAGGGEPAEFLVITGTPSSPAGVMVRENWGGVAITASELDGSNSTSVTINGRGYRVDASPRSSLVAYHGRGYESDLRIHLADPYSGSVWRLTGQIADDALQSERWPRFSADGTWIYFMGWGEGSRRWELWRARTDREGIERLEQDPQGSYRFPAPSFTGDRVAYTQGGAASISQDGPLEIFNLVTGQTSSVGVQATTSRWAPQDDWIAYTNAAHELRLVRPDGADHREPVPGLQVGPGFDWSPDGDFILATTTTDAPLLIEVATGAVTSLGASSTAGSVAFY